jgi:hypothetical protein
MRREVFSKGVLFLLRYVLVFVFIVYKINSKFEYYISLYTTVINNYTVLRAPGVIL